MLSQRERTKDLNTKDRVIDTRDALSKEKKNLLVHEPRRGFNQTLQPTLKQKERKKSQSPDDLEIDEDLYEFNSDSGRKPPNKLHSKKVKGRKLRF